jgi:Flp pilus assembly protein TadD
MLAAPVRPPRVTFLLLVLCVCSSISWCDAPSDSSTGRDLFNRGKYAEAAAVLEKLLAIGRADATDLAVLGLCYTNLDRPADAQGVLDMARALGPSNSLVYIALGTLAFTRKDFDLALTHFDRASRLDPGSLQAKNGMVASLVNRGVLLFQAGTSSEARKAFQSALAVDPRAVQAMRNLGIVELKEGDAKRAAELFEQALKLSVEDPQLLQLLIAALESLQDQARLLQAYARLTKAQPSNAEAFAGYGVLLERQAQREEAEQAFKRSEELGTDEPYPYLHLARLSIGRGEKGDASRLLQQAVGKSIQKTGRIQAQAAQKVEEAKGSLASEDLAQLEGMTRLAEEPRQILQESLLLLRSIARDPAAFETDLIDLSSWYPQSTDLRVALGRFYEEQGRWADALALWERLLEKHPTIAEAHVGLALSLERSGSLLESASAYLRALDLAPDDSGVYDGLERVYGSLHREEELRQKLLDRSFRDTLNPLLFSRLGLLERALGHLEESKAHLEEAAKLEQVRK